MKRGNMAVLLYNALDTELFLQYTFGDEAYDFETNETKTLLSYYLKVNHTVATVEATYAASAVSPAPKLLSDEVRIGGVTMKAGETDVQSMLGMRADVYTREDEITEKPIILAIVPRPTVATVDLVAKDIEGLDGMSLSYVDAEGVQREADLTNAKVVYNGRIASKDEAHLKPAIGTVRLISDNNEYKYAIVESFTNYVVERVSAEDYTIFFRDTTSVVIDPSNKVIATCFTDADDKSLSVSDVKEWDILSIARDNEVSPSVLRVYRSNRVVEGKITEKSEDANEVVIADTSYPFAPALSNDLRVGMSAGFCLDNTGTVAAINEAYQSDGTYGWLVSAAITKGLDGKPQLKIFTQKGEMKVFDVTENIKFNEGNMKSSELLKPGAEFATQWVANARPSLIDSAGTVVSQLLKYEVNDAGLIRENVRDF